MIIVKKHAAANGLIKVLQTIVLVSGTRPKHTKETNVVMAETLPSSDSSTFSLLFWYEIRRREDVSLLFLIIRFVIVSNSFLEYPDYDKIKLVSIYMETRY